MRSSTPYYDNSKFDGLRNPQLWALPLDQQYKSRRTSINAKKLPAGIRRALDQGVWFEGMINLDIGGGSFDNTTEAIADTGARNFTYDPWNRTMYENVHSAEVAERGVDTVTIHNTLNVILEDELLDRILRQAWAALKPGGRLMITVYEGNRSGVGHTTHNCNSWQRNAKLASYLPFVKRHFKTVVREGSTITATKPAEVPAVA